MLPPTDAMVNGLATGPSRMDNSSGEKNDSLGMIKTRNGINNAITTGKPCNLGLSTLDVFRTT